MQVCARLLLLAAAGGELLFVAEMSRHGSRAPVNPMPWDEDGRWSIGFGELTPSGMRQHYLIGAELRQRLVVAQSFLPADYNASLFYFRSTDVNRTLMSAESQLTGLFPQGPLLSTHDQVDAVPPISVNGLTALQESLASMALPHQRQPFPVYTEPSELDLVLRPNTACIELVNQGNQLVASSQYNATAYEDSLVISVLQNVLPGVDLTKKFLDIFNSILCNLFVGYPLPQEFTEEFLQRGTAVFNKLFSMYYANDNSARLYASGFFEELITHLTAVQAGAEPTLFRYYSSHEETVAGVIAGLQVAELNQPPFASTLLFLVSQEETGPVVQVVYNDKELLVPGCPSSACPLGTFIEYLRMRALPDYEELCFGASAPWGNETESHSESAGSRRGSSDVLWEGWLTVALCAVALIAATALCFFTKRSSEGPVKYTPLEDSGELMISKKGLSVQQNLS